MLYMTLLASGSGAVNFLRSCGPNVVNGYIVYIFKYKQ